MKNIVFLVSLSGLLALGACEINVKHGAGGGGAGGSGAGAPCITCAEAITEGTVDDMCPESTSAQIYLDLYNCLCGGACAGACGDNLCVDGESSSPDCEACIGDDSPSGCGVEYDTCANDF